MSDDRKRPVASIGVRRKEGDQWKSYSVVAVWATQYDGLFNANLDRGNERRPAMSPIDAIKALASGASLEIRTGNGGQRKPEPRRDDFGGGNDFSDDNLPF
jgi:hypothetical protein